MRHSIIVLFITLLTVLGACNKSRFDFSEGTFTFSTDTLIFDTIFTTIGSTTQNFKVFNNKNSGLKIDEIRLMGGTNSPFRLNIDGVSGTSQTNVEILAKDSLFLFVEVTLEVNNVSNPLIIEDSILFRSGSSEAYVNLVVWGQDAYFHVNEIVSGVWPNDKPHVIYGTAAVGFPGIDSNLTLDIDAGTRVHGHKNSQLVVYKSQLNINGTLGNEVIFQGDRLEEYYSDVPGQWWGIRYIQAGASTINYAEVKNAAIALQVDTTGTGNPLLTINNSKFYNNDFFSIYLVAGANVLSTNSLYGNAGYSSAYFFAGGSYEFTNCTFGDYWPGSRDYATFALQNYFQAGGITYVRAVPKAYFRNCAIDGSRIDELTIDTVSHPVFDMQFESCAVRNTTEYSGVGFTNMFYNQDFNFQDSYNNDYHFSLLSVLDGNANPIFAPATDLDGNLRSGSTPDIGCYEM